MTRRTHTFKRAPLWGTLCILALLVLQACEFNPPGDELTPYDIQNDWRVGNTVLLARGTEIREAPSNDSCWHTRVPVDRWEVRVTRDAGGGWYDTSRAALGDVSGGTGFVNRSQADHFPPVQYEGPQCSYSVQRPPPELLRTEGDTPTDVTGGLAEFFVTIQIWWRSLPLVVQLAVVVIAIAVLFFTFRRATGTLTGLVQALMFGVIFWWVAEQTRGYWENWWSSFAASSAPGFPIVIGLVPIVWWGYSQLKARLPGGLRVLLLIALLVIGFYLIAPQRLDQWVSGVQSWLKPK